MFDKNKKDKIAETLVVKAKCHSKSKIMNIINKNENYFKIELKKDNVFALVENNIDNLNQKIDSNHHKLGKLVLVGKGMETAANEVFVFKDYPKQFPPNFIKRRISGQNIKKYYISPQTDYILYFEDIDKFENLPEEIQNYLIKNKEVLENRADKKRRKTAKWWNYSFPMHKEYYHLEKLWCSYRCKENCFAFDNTGEYIGLTNTTVIFDTNSQISLKYILSLLNSKVLNFRYKSIGKQTGGGIFEYFENGISKLPIPKIPEVQQQPFIALVDQILENKKRNIDTTDLEKKIDEMVYKLYDLTEEEIKIIEGK